MSLSAILSRQVGPGLPAVPPEVLELAGDLARLTSDVRLLVRVSQAAGCPSALADELWASTDVLPLLAAAGTGLRSAALSPSGFERLVASYLSRPLAESAPVFKVLLAGLRSRLSGSSSLPDRLREPLVRAGDALAWSAVAASALDEDVRVFDDLSQVVSDVSGWMVSLATRLDLALPSHSLLATRLARSGLDEVVAALPWGVPALDARSGGEYLNALLSHLAQHCRGERSREVLATLGDEWSGSVGGLVEACSRL